MPSAGYSAGAITDVVVFCRKTRPLELRVNIQFHPCIGGSSFGIHTRGDPVRLQGASRALPFRVTNPGAGVW